MKHIRVLSLLLFIGILPCTAQLKVVQKSAKNTGMGKYNPKRLHRHLCHCRQYRKGEKRMYG